jgi:hypothetical protein
LSDKVTEAVIAAVPSSKAEIQSDGTLTIVSSIARNTGSSASLPVRKTNKPQKKPLQFNTPPTFAATPVKTTRSLGVENAIKQVATPPAGSGLNSGQISQATVATVASLNNITRNQDVDKTQKETAIALMVGAVQKIYTNVTLNASARANVIGSTAVAIGNVAANLVKDPTVSATAVATVIDTTTTMVTKLAESKTTTGTQQSEQAAAVVNTVNTIISNPTISATDRQAFVNTTATIVNKATTDTKLTTQAQTDLITVTLGTLATVTSDTKTDPNAKKAILEFASKQIVAAIDNPALTTSTGVSESIKAIANETKAVTAAVGTAGGTVKVEDAIKQSETKVADAVKAVGKKYGSP